MIRIAIAVVGVALLTGQVFAEPSGSIVVDADVRFGLATTPFDVMTLPEAKGQALTFVAGANYQFSPGIAVEVHVPLVLASVAQPAGSYVDQAAIGNPQIGASYRLTLRELALSVGVDVGVPIASHDEALMANRALAIANGVDGLAHPEQFTPGMLPITPFARLRRVARQWGVEAGARLPVMARISDADASSTRPIGVAGVLVVEAWRCISRRLVVAPTVQLYVEGVPAADHVRSVSRIQDLERVSLDIAVSTRATLAVDLQTAAAGELGGSTFGLGLRMVVVLP